MMSPERGWYWAIVYDEPEPVKVVRSYVIVSGEFVKKSNVKWWGPEIIMPKEEEWPQKDK